MVSHVGFELKTLSAVISDVAWQQFKPLGQSTIMKETSVFVYDTVIFPIA